MKPFCVLLPFLFPCIPWQVLAFPQPEKGLIIIADNQTFPGGKKLELSFKPKTLQIVINAPNQSNEKQVYEIEMKGIIEPYITTDPVARYTFLPGGEHQFQYRIIQDGISSGWVTQQINIKRGIIEMPWFYPILLVYLFFVVGAIIYFWVIYNLRQNLKLQTLRSKISANLHDDTGSTLSSISLDLETLESLLPAGNEKLIKMITETRHAVEEAILKLRDTLWSIQPEHDDIFDLAGRIGQSAAKMFAFKNTQLEFINQLSTSDNFQISMERRGDVLHIAKEALNNALKYAHATKVLIQLTPVPNGVQLLIVDDGIGFHPDEARDKGNGLRNFQLRAANSLLDVKIQSKPGSGTRVSVAIPQL